MGIGRVIGGVSGPGSGAPRQLISPVDGGEIATIDECNRQDVSAAITAAAAAYGPWSVFTPGERSRLLLRFADVIEAHVDELTELEVAETGKPIPVARDGEIPFAVDNLRFFAAAARSLEGSGAGTLSTGYTSMLVRRPLGVVAGIAPWNFPLVMAIWKLGPALAAGNSLVLKPAPTTPSSTLRLAELAIGAGLPAGVLNVVTGDADVAQQLVADPRVSLVSITGSPEAGRAVMATAAEQTKRVHLELGGKAPALVFADADLPTTAAGLAMAATYNSGQDCTAATRVYVEREVSQEFTSLLAAALDRVRVGHPAADTTDIGPLISTEHRARVHGFVERALAAGGHLVTGGRLPDGPGAFYPPTLITGARQDGELMQQEVFGPVVALLEFDDEDEAVALANDSAYGLASSVWSCDVARALRVAQRIEAGVTWVNDHLPIASEAPHGGVKGSGFGKDLSQEALADYSVTQHIMLRHSAPPQHDSFRPA